MNKKLLSAIVIVIVLIAGVLYLNSDITKKQNEGVGGILSKDLVELSDDNPTFDHWGKNFPDYLDMYLTVETEKPIATEFGGNLAYSKLIRYPQLTVLWAGYPFSLDANEERGHFWIQVDQMDTARNNKDFLNAHGFKAFGGQPAACMNCHSGWTPWLLNNTAKGDWVAFNSAKYWTMIKTVPAVNGYAENSAEHSGPHGGKRMGVTCADCHNPNDMSLRLTRPAAINALVSRGYEKDPVAGIKATREEMRTLVCSQCHVEYYFKPTGTKVKTIGETIAQDPSKKWFDGTQKTYDEFDSLRDGNQFTEIEVAGIELAFPWSEWKKGQPFRIEMFDDYYDKVRANFDKDWAHKLSGAPMIKIQHPESELYSGGVHAANGVSCADCHMPYIRKGAKKLTQHNVTSPLQDINAACKTCHTQSEDYLKAQILDIQKSVAYDLRSAEYATVSLIMDIKNLRELLGAKAEYQTDGKADQAKISAALKEVLELHRKAQMRGDFVGAENSTGFHNPREASRMLLQAVEMAREGQTKLVQIAAANGINDFKTSNLGFEDIQKLNPGEIRYKVDMNGHKAGDRYYQHEEINGNPPAEYLEFDKNTKPYNYQVIDKY
ncbi:ammonia-forming cytochrome c nitrite reductase subunit c552 [Campylobacter sp. MIT 12-5580]|uniref:ammonia-forming cytochrome c nitrite reductase subunit c552 n=1 Tax=unclassified Campylobacter TaxID=2593542 RepID=UPI0010F51C3F|nr:MULTISPECIES: ammonia-forming cytochrome c nitrite reductase subunit c552 [unclassified Campylobacter]NDJ26577.1 ammonia-forming cytochrome c nitrite reductase subunit c552 [Campylobacter sp. MIT 19-121]TKX29235.1 ammonia-forming cytochrome c nitrite reductase subunit c552 [Campylobacter sp. MIT 12-5580]